MEKGRSHENPCFFQNIKPNLINSLSPFFWESELQMHITFGHCSTVVIVNKVFWVKAPECGEDASHIYQDGTDPCPFEHIATIQSGNFIKVPEHNFKE